MAIIAPKSEKKEFEIVKAGSHVGIAYSLIMLGTHEEEWEGTEKKSIKMFLSFELPNLRKVFKEGEPEKPMSISTYVNLSMYSQSKLRGWIHNIIGVTLTDKEADSFDVMQILGKPCLLNVIHKLSKKSGKMKTNIEGVAQMIEGMPVPVQFNPNRVVNLFENLGGKWDEEVYKGLPEFIRKDIDASLERNKKPSKVQDEVNKFDAAAIQYPEEAASDEIHF